MDAVLSEEDFEEKTDNSIIDIKVDFKESQQITFILTSTGQKNITCVSDEHLCMMLGRLYYIPVNTKLDSDNYYLKVLGNIADQIDVRYIRDGIACILPLRHNIKLIIGQQICQFKTFKKEEFAN